MLATTRGVVGAVTGTVVVVVVVADFGFRFGARPRWNCTGRLDIAAIPGNAARTARAGDATGVDVTATTATAGTGPFARAMYAPVDANATAATMPRAPATWKRASPSRPAGAGGGPSPG